MTAYKYRLDEQRKAVPVEDLGEWAEWFDKGNHSVARNHYCDNGELVVVATCFLGLDFNFGTGKPLLFETKVHGGRCAGSMHRTSTWEEAEEDHHMICQRIESLLCKEGSG